MLGFSQIAALPLSRWTSNHQLLKFGHLRLRTNHGLPATSRKKVATLSDAEGGEDAPVVKTKATKKPKRKPKVDTGEDDSSKKSETRRNVVDSDLEEPTVEKKTRRRRSGKKEEDSLSIGETSEPEEDLSAVDETDGLDIHGGEDISHTYCWPPLVCCFGAALHAFVPSGRPANRLIDYEIHDSMKDALWEPEKFVRAPGGCAGSVAIALANLGGKVAFMGKLGNDDFGRAMLYYLNMSNVQTRALRIDPKKTTAVAQVKISKRGRMRATCTKPSAEDSLPKSDLSIDVLKEAKMFYFSTHSLLEPAMRATTLQAIMISKKLGGVIFYDLNLPLPLWQSSEETKSFIQEFWNLADVIEITKQELEFLCGIIPENDFDSRNNAKSKFRHYPREEITPIWHEDLKVLFVTNGTSKVHYYTADHDGAVQGMEDSPVTPFTADMSASGDGIVAGIMRMLSVMPHMMTDKGYLNRTIHYAMRCGATDQWLLSQTRGFPPIDDMADDVESDDNGIRSVTQREYRTVRTKS